MPTTAPGAEAITQVPAAQTTATTTPDHSTSSGRKVSAARAGMVRQ